MVKLNEKQLGKEDVYLDLIKCSENEQKHIFSLLPTNKITAQIYYMIRNSDWEVLKAFSYLFFNEQNVWQLCSNPFTEIKDKTELTYKEFIKLFKDGDGENQMYTKEDIENAYRAGENKQTYYFKDTTVILPTTYEGVDG